MFSRFVQFFLTCLVGTLVDTLILWLCAHCLFDGTYWGENILSPCISFECAVATNFALSYFVVWRDRITSIQSLRSATRHFIGYNGSCIAGFLIKMGFLQIFLNLLHIDVVFCNLIALCFSGIFNFLMSDKVIFRQVKQASSTEEESSCPTPSTEKSE